MNVHINHQIIKKDGKPVFVLLPYEEYVEYIHDQPGKDEKKIYFPMKLLSCMPLKEKVLSGHGVNIRN